MKRAATSLDNTESSNSLFCGRKISILDALAAQFHEKFGLKRSQGETDFPLNTISIYF